MEVSEEGSEEESMREVPERKKNYPGGIVRDKTKGNLRLLWEKRLFRKREREKIPKEKGNIKKDYT